MVGKSPQCAGNVEYTMADIRSRLLTRGSSQKKKEQRSVNNERETVHVCSYLYLEGSCCQSRGGFVDELS